MISYLFSPTDRQIHLSNQMFYVLVLCAGPLIGSGITVVAIGGIVWSLYHVVRGTVPQIAPWQVLWSAYVFGAFVVIEFVAGFAAAFDRATIAEVVSNLIFLGVLPLFLITRVERRKLVFTVELGAAGFSITASLLVLVTPFGAIDRVELAAGNAGILAVLSAMLFLLNVLAVIRNQGRMRFAAVLGVLCSSHLMIETGMRTLLPVLIVLPVLALIFAWRSKLFTISRPIVFVLLLAPLVAAAVFSNQIQSRLQLALNDIRSIENGQMDNSLGMRVTMWSAGWKLVQQRPVLGYGIGSLPNMMKNATSSQAGPTISFSHFHNAFLNQMIRAGIIGALCLLAMFVLPLWWCYRAKKDTLGYYGFVFLLGTQFIFMLSGLTGIMLHHDIMDALFVSASVFALYCVFSPLQAGNIPRADNPPSP